MSTAFFIRQNIHKDLSKEALQNNRVYLGWSHSKDVMDYKDDYYRLRDYIKEAYYNDRTDYRKAGMAASQVWRFLNVIELNTMVVIPGEGGIVYKGRITSDCKYDDSSFGSIPLLYREVIWESKGVERRFLNNNLQRAMKGYQTVIDISAYANQLEEDIDVLNNNENLSLGMDIKKGAYNHILTNLYEGRVNNYKFEKLIEALLTKLGYDAIIVPRSKDIGADIRCEYKLIGNIVIPVYVQVKQFEPGTKVNVDVANQLLIAMQKDKTLYGIIVSTGLASEELNTRISEINDGGDPETLSFVGGDDLCDLLIESRIFPDFDF